MNLYLKSHLTIALAFTLTHCSIALASDPVPDWETIRDSWKAYYDSLNNVQGDVDSETVRPDGKIIRTMSISFRSNGTKGIYKNNVHSMDDGMALAIKADGSIGYEPIPNAPPGNAELVLESAEAYLLNDRYSASLRIGRDGKTWVPKHFGAAAAIDDLERHYVGNMRDHALVMLSLGPVNLREFWDTDRFQVLGVRAVGNSDPPKLVRIDFSFDSPTDGIWREMQLSEGWMELDPERGFLPVRTRADFGNVKMSWIKSFEYKTHEGKAIPLLTASKLSIGRMGFPVDKAAPRSTAHFNLWFDDNIPDKEFTMAAFGLPDMPEGVDIPESIGTAVRDLTGASDASFLERSWVYLLILALGIVGGGLSIYMFIRARKRAMAA